MKKFRFYLLTLISFSFLILPFKRVEATPTIKRLEEIVMTEANLYFWELYSDKKTIRSNSQFRRCARDYKNKNIVVCLTNNGSFSNGRDVLWYFDMKQKLAFKIGGYKAGGGPCKLNRVRIIGMYNDGQFANENDIPIDAFSSSFDSYMKVYNYVNQCPDNLTWRFYGGPFYNVKVFMPWEGYCSIGDGVLNSTLSYDASKFKWKDCF